MNDEDGDDVIRPPPLSRQGYISLRRWLFTAILFAAVPTTATSLEMKSLICVRHAKSLANEMMERPGNRWGDPTFADDVGLVDAPVSAAGRAQLEKLGDRTIGDDVELVLVSPMRRCLQTYRDGVRPSLGECEAPVVACPLLTERVYTTSDTGRPLDEVKNEYPEIDFSECHERWWFVHDDNNGPYQEWRPHGEGQFYGVPGETDEAFEQRMEKLENYLRNERKETSILLVTHWGVLCHLAKGQTEFRNAEVRKIDFV